MHMLEKWKIDITAQHDSDANPTVLTKKFSRSVKALIKRTHPVRKSYLEGKRKRILRGKEEFKEDLGWKI